MKEHAFIFLPGIWKGEGLICFSMASDQIPFQMQWTIEPMQNGVIVFHQVVAIEELGQQMRNDFTLMQTAQDRFKILLKNSLVEGANGLGLIDPRVIAWEFRGQEAFEGFEVYEKEAEGRYKMRGEYMTSDTIRTIVNGVISQE